MDDPTSSPASRGNTAANVPRRSSTLEDTRLDDWHMDEETRHDSPAHRHSYVPILMIFFR